MTESRVAGQHLAELGLVAAAHQANVTLVVGAEGVAEHPGPLRAQLVVAGLGEILVAPALEQHDAQPAFGQLVGDDATGRSGAHHDRIDFVELHISRPSASRLRS